MMMRKIWVLLLFAGMLAVYPAHSRSGDIIINEIMFNPDGDENAREFVELYNAGDAAVSLESWRIGDGTALDEIVPAADGGWMIPAESYAVIFDPDYFVKDEPYLELGTDAELFTVSDKAIGSRGLSNSTAETVTLISADGETVDAVTYDLECTPGHSWERLSFDSAEFSESAVTEGSPGSPNTVSGLDGDDGDKGKLTTDPNPFGDFTRISYSLPFPYARVTLSIYDRRGRMLHTFRDAEDSGSTWSCEWDGRADGSRLPAGPYILRCEALNRESGAMTTLTKTIVVGTRL